MICQPTYNSLEEIPENLREEFELSKGVYKLKASAIPGVDKLFNEGLVENARRAVEQAKNRRDKIKELEKINEDLEAKLALTEDPGGEILDKQAAEQWKRYSALGTPDEFEKLKSSYASLESEVKVARLKETVEKISKESKLNPDVLMDWVKESPNISFIRKEVKVTEKGKESIVSEPWARVETTSPDGKVTVEEKPLLDAAKASLADWKFAVLTKPSEGKPPQASPSGVRLPSFSKTEGEGEPIQKSFGRAAAEKLNAARMNAPSPFKKMGIQKNQASAVDKTTV